MIPKQLQNEKFRFIVVKKGEKVPVEEKWTTVNNYVYNDPTFLNYLNKGYNYGVLCGSGNLLVIDFDSKIWQDKIEKLLPDTLTIKTAGKGMHHSYLIVDNPESFKILDKAKETIMDIQGRARQVVGANSKLDNGNIYEIVNDVPIAEMAISELKALLTEVFPDDWLPKQMQKRAVKEKIVTVDPVIKIIKENMVISQLLNEANVPIDKNPTECPFHSSKGGKCLGFDDEQGVWHCFHCEEKGDLIHLYQKIYKVSFRLAKQQLAKKLNIQDDLLKDVRSSVFQLLINKKRDEAVELLTQTLYDKNVIYTLRSDEVNEIWIYVDGIYVPHGKTYIIEHVRSILEDAYSITMANATINKVVADTFIKKEDFFENKYPYKIAVQNGILDLKNRKLEAFTPDYFFFAKLTVSYDPVVDCPVVKHHLNTVLPSEDDVAVIQELVGFTLVKDYFIEKAFMFLGSGRNGKSKTVNIIEALLGADNCACVKLQQFEKNLFLKGELHNKLANLGADISNISLKETDSFKELTGRDLIMSDRKFKSPILFRNYAKMIFCANQLPKTYDDSDGFFDRWLLFDFPYKFVSNHVLAQIPEEERGMLKSEDTDIIARLTTEEELTGVLNWALDGLDRLLQNKKFSYSRSSAEVKKMWLRKSNSVIAYIEDNMVEVEDGIVVKRDFKFEYHKFCKKYGLRPESDKSIKNTLTIKYGASEEYPLVNGQQERCWVGLAFVDGELAKKTQRFIGTEIGL